MNSTLSKEINDADFVNLAFNCVGIGIIPTGNEFFDLAKRYAQQESRREAIEFGKFLGGVQSGKIKVQMHLMITFDELYDLYTKQKQG